MTEASIITEEVKGLLGVEMNPKVVEIEKSMIKRFAEAIEDTNPLWQDKDYAQNSKYGNIVAPPTFVHYLRSAEFVRLLLDTKCPATRILNGGNEIEFFHPIKVGDIISITDKVVDIYEREGKAGKMLFIVWESVYKNQKKDTVARVRSTLIRY